MQWGFGQVCFKISQNAIELQQLKSDSKRIKRLKIKLYISQILIQIYLGIQHIIKIFTKDNMENMNGATNGLE